MTNSIVRENPMDDEWLNPRLYYLKKIIHHQPNYCPECDTTLETDECTVYCPKCGLVVADSYPYVAGFPVNYVYGLKLG